MKNSAHRNKPVQRVFSSTPPPFYSVDPVFQGEALIPPARRFLPVLVALLGALLFVYGDVHAHSEGGAEAKVFIHPETGEILSREQWEELGIENEGADAEFSSSAEAPRPQNPPAVFQGRQIDLGNGDYVIVVDAPEDEMVETKVWFDEEGKAHIRCNH